MPQKAPTRARRYFSQDDIETGVTGSQLKRLSRARQGEYVEYWFRSRYEDPANDTPYVTAEGGYQWVYGGPYDAEEEIRSEFEGVVREDVIDSVVKEVEADGLEWAPGRNHPARDRFIDDDDPEGDDEEVDLARAERELETAERWLKAGRQAGFGDTADRAQRQQITRAIEALQSLLPRTTPGIGHNGPPDDDGVGEPSVPEIELAAEDIKQELKDEEPDVARVARSAKVLLAAAKWLGGKINKFADSAVTAAGTSVGGSAGALAVLSPEQAGALLHQLTITVSQSALWLINVLSPF